VRSTSGDAVGHHGPHGLWELVPDAVDDQQLGARDRRRRGPPATDADERVGSAVDDECRHIETTQRLRTVRGGQAGLQLAGESRRVVGAIEGSRRPRPHTSGAIG